MNVFKKTEQQSFELKHPVLNKIINYCAKHKKFLLGFFVGATIMMIMFLIITHTRIDSICKLYLGQTFHLFKK